MRQGWNPPSNEREFGRGDWRDSQLERRVISAEGGTVYQIKVYEDTLIDVVGDDAFVWVVPAAFDDAEVVLVEGAYSQAGGGTGEFQLRLSDPCDVGADILSTKLTIQAGDCNDDGTCAVSGTPVLHTGDHLHIDVDQAGGGLGLNIALTLLNSETAAVVIQGAKGDPGGVTAFTGAWSGGAATTWTTATGYAVGDIVENGGTFYIATSAHTSGATTEPGVGVNWATVWDEVTYSAGESVSNGGTTYVAIVDHTATVDSEPGVGADWEDFWQLLVERNPNSGFQVMIHGNGFALDVGIKAAVPIPFDCEIVEVTLLADAAGSVVVDLWKDTYGSYPPTDADSITAAAPPTLSSANKTTDTALTGWDTGLAVGDVLMVVIESTSGLNWLNVALRVARP